MASDGQHRGDDLAYLRGVWRTCGDTFGMTEAVPGIDLEPDWDRGSGVLAGRTRPGDGVYQAILRREHDVFCVSVMLEPAYWAEVDRRWSVVLGQLLGEVVDG